MIKKLNPISSLAISLFRTHQALLECGEAIAIKHNMSAARWKFLGALTLAQTPLTVPQIAKNMGLTRQAVQRLADELNELSYVKIHINPMHKRSKLYVLTPLGEKLYHLLNDDWLKIVHQLQTHVSSQDINQTLNGLNNLFKALEEIKK